MKTHKRREYVKTIIKHECCFIELRSNTQRHSGAAFLTMVDNRPRKGSKVTEGTRWLPIIRVFKLLVLLNKGERTSKRHQEGASAALLIPDTLRIKLFMFSSTPTNEFIFSHQIHIQPSPSGLNLKPRAASGGFLENSAFFKERFVS